MPRQITDQPIRTKSQRARLESRRKPYFRRLSDNLALGYRRTATLPGVWVVRRRNDDGTYSETKLAGVSPDDVATANGIDILSFDQACDRARVALAPAPEEITLEQAAQAWADAKIAESDRETQHIKVRNTARRIARAFPAGLMLHKMTAPQIQRWRDNFLKDAADADAARARRATANRELATLKAICNKAVRDNRLDIPRPWETVPKFPRVEAFGKRVVTLTNEERQRWIDSAPDIATANFLKALILTGCRSGELVAARVRDLAGRRLTVSGKQGGAR